VPRRGDHARAAPPAGDTSSTIGGADRSPTFAVIGDSAGSYHRRGNGEAQNVAPPSRADDRW
jgi:hypothetical protein